MPWVLGTAWICAVCQLLAVLLSIVVKGVVSCVSGRERPMWRVAFTGLWTVACLLLAAHMAAAFHFLHGWSHSAAWRHTATRTGEEIGFYWGGGIYANYLALALWATDVVMRWWKIAADKIPIRPPSTHSSSAILKGKPTSVLSGFHQSTYLYLLFLQFQATVVFGGVTARALGVTFLVVASGVWVIRWRRSKR